MKTQWIKILSGVLAAQLALYLLFSFGGQQDGEFKKSQPLVELGFGDVDKLVITDGDSKSITLEKKDAFWVLPDYHQVKINKDKLTDIESKVLGTKVSWPVSQTSIAAKQFNVVDESFERRLEFYKGGEKLKTLYLGSSPSFKKVHARVEGSDLTYAISYNAYDIPAKESDWLAKDLLKLERADVQSVEINGILLTQKEGDFVLENLPEGKETNRLKVNPLISTLLNPDYEDILGTNKSVVAASKKEHTFALKTANESITYQVFELKDEKKADTNESKDSKDAPAESEFVALEASNQPYIFKLRRARLSSFIDLNADKLQKDKSDGSEQTGKKQETGENSGNESSMIDDDDSLERLSH